MKEKVLKFICTKSGKLGLTIALYGVLFALLMVFIGTDLMPLLGATLLACAIGGWKALNRIQPSMFLVMSWMGWLIYFLIKTLLSIFIGAFVTPYVLSSKIAGVIQEYVKRYDKL